MLSEYLLPETTIRENGTGPVIPLDKERPDTLLLTLGITRIREQEGIDIAIWGSPDGANWGPGPLVSFSQKFYIGTYPLCLDLSCHSSVKYLRTAWRVNRWGRGDAKPLFTVSLLMQQTDRHLTAIGA
jgi:hypothetical protein